MSPIKVLRNCWAAELPDNKEKKTNDMNDLDLDVERANEKAGSVTYRGHVSTSPSKTGAVPPPLGSYSGISRLSCRLTSKDLVSNHDMDHEWCQHAFPLATTESFTVLEDEHMANGLCFAAAQVSS